MAMLPFSDPSKPPPPPDGPPNAGERRADTASAGRRPHGTAEVLRRRRRKKRRAQLIAGLLAIAILAGAAIVGVYVIRPELGSETGKTDEDTAETPSAAPPALRQRKMEIEDRWEELQTVELPGGLEKKRSDARSVIDAMRAAWDAGRFEEAKQRLKAAERRIDRIEERAVQQKEAIAARQRAERAEKKAKKTDAADVAPTAWATAKKAAARAEEAFDEAAFESARSGWEEAVATFQKAGKRAGMSEEAKSAKSAFSLRSGLNYEQEAFEEAGGKAWAKLAETRKRANAALSAGKYEKAKELFDRARKQVPKVERAVRRTRGVHYYALRAGYLASDVLFQRASTDDAAAASVDPLKATLTELRLSDEIREDLAAAKDEPYASLAGTLLGHIREAIEERHGTTVASSFRIGTQVRILEGLLAKDREKLGQQVRVRIRNVRRKIERTAESVGYPTPITEATHEVRAALEIDPDFEAVRRARKRWDAFVKKLDEYESGSDVVPRPDDG